jgi:hypothetical protein
MDQGKFGKEMDDNILLKVHEGMRVVDREDQELGTVDQVYLGSVSEESQARGEGPADTTSADITGSTGSAAGVFGMAGQGPVLLDFAFGGGISPSEISETEVRDLLLRHGFIRLNAGGLFAPDRYIMPDMISSVSDDVVVLTLSKDELKNR